MGGTALYYLVLLAAAIPALAGRLKKPSLGWALYFFLLLIFVGLRHQIGSDWPSYLYIAEIVGQETFADVLQQEEFLYYLAVWISVNLGLEIYGANVLTTAIFLAGLFSFCRKQTNPWLAIYSAVPFLVIVIGMSANRQSAAIGVTFYLLSVWRDTGIVYRLILIAIAIAFHTSAAIFLLLFVLDGKISGAKKILLAVGIVGLVFFYLGGTQSIGRYTDAYINDGEIYVAAGALQQIVLNAFPGLLVIFSGRRLRSRIVQYDFIYAMSLFSVALIPVGVFYSVAAARISFYLFPVSVALLSTLPESSSNGPTRLMIRYFVILYGVLTLALWLTFANHAYNHKPYDNFLFG